MGKIGEEITQKIKSAVKAKLIELGIEVDNELPDYIMVLVANKKNQAQMEKDLQLFLGPNTVLFTTWLLNVLKKLEEVTVSNKNFKRIEVTNEEGSSGVIINTDALKREEVPENNEPSSQARIKVEPGTEAPDDFLDIRSGEDPTLEDDTNDRSETKPGETYSSDTEDSEGQARMDQGTNLPGGSPQHNEETDNAHSAVVAGDTTANMTSSHGRNVIIERDESSESMELDLCVGSNDIDDNSSETAKSQTNGQSQSKINDSSRPKIVYAGITRQIEEVMEKTLKDNKRPREDRSRHEDESSRSHDDRGSLKNRRKSDDNTTVSQDDSRSRDDERDRQYQFRGRSLDRRTRSQEDRRRSPDDRGRPHESRRRSPDYRRRSSEDRRRSPVDRRRSPDDRKRPYDDRRRLHDDRSKIHDDHRRSPDDRSRSRLTDAREILKRRSNKNEDLSPADHSSKEESHRNEKKRKVIASLVHKPEGSTRNEEPPEPTIQSLVRVTPRPIRRDAIQPNKKLLLLAVADAEKSVSRRPSSSQPSSLSSRKRELPKSTVNVTEESPTTAGYVPPAKIFVTLTNQKFSNDDKGNCVNTSREVSTRKIYEEPELTLEDELVYEESYFDYEKEDTDVEEVAPAENSEYLAEKEKSSQNKLNSGSDAKCIISLDSSSERSCDEWEDTAEELDQVQDVVDTSSVEKSEAVTEEKLECVPAERLEDGFEWSRLGPAPVATVKPLSQGSGGKVEKFKCEAMNKALERCKFWPNCMNSDTCIYYHPSSPCKMFPMCKSGNECLFIHPECKFGAACLNPKCNFLHKNPLEKKQESEVVPPPAVSPAKAASPLVKCLYFPNCKNLSCKFWHPVKNCKYGRTCARSDCYFFHPTLVIPPKQLLSWTASKN